MFMVLVFVFLTSQEVADCLSVDGKQRLNSYCFDCVLGAFSIKFPLSQFCLPSVLPSPLAGEGNERAAEQVFSCQPGLAHHTQGTCQRWVGNQLWLFLLFGLTCLLSYCRLSLDQLCCSCSGFLYALLSISFLTFFHIMLCSTGEHLFLKRWGFFQCFYNQKKHICTP